MEVYWQKGNGQKPPRTKPSRQKTLNKTPEQKPREPLRDTFLLLNIGGVRDVWRTLWTAPSAFCMVVAWLLNWNYDKKPMISFWCVLAHRLLGIKWFKNSLKSIINGAVGLLIVAVMNHVRFSTARYCARDFDGRGFDCKPRRKAKYLLEFFDALRSCSLLKTAACTNIHILYTRVVNSGSAALPLL